MVTSIGAKFKLCEAAATQQRNGTLIECRSRQFHEFVIYLSENCHKTIINLSYNCHKSVRIIYLSSVLVHKIYLSSTGIDFLLFSLQLKVDFLYSLIHCTQVEKM